MHLGSLESTQETRVALGATLKGPFTHAIFDAIFVALSLQLLLQV